MSKARKILRWVVLALFAIGGLVPIAIAGEPLWLFGGSDAGGCCLQARPWAQLVAWGGTVAALVWRALVLRGAAQIASLVLAAGGYVLSLHGLCHSDRQGVFEHWAGLRLRGLPVDPADGELSLDASGVFMHVTADGDTFSVFRGVPPWWIPSPGPLGCGE